MLMVACGVLALVAVVAVALVAVVVAGFAIVSLVAPGVTVVGFVAAGFVVLAPVVRLVPSWLVFAAPLRALRAFEALLSVLAFTG
jgi:hypothetical protein